MENNINNSNLSNNEIIEKIVQEVALSENISADEIYSKVKSSYVSRARNICMYIISKLTDCDYTTIGKKFSKHYASVMYAIGCINNEIKNNKFFASEIKHIIHKVQNTYNYSDDSKLTFNNFIVNWSNNNTYYYAKAVAENTFCDYNPLYIIGEKGVGKSHLLNAIRYEIYNRFPHLQITYLKANQITDELLNYINENTDVLLIDDFQTLNVKQESILNTIELLIENKKQIVIASDRAPDEIEFLNDNLCLIFKNGMVTNLLLPECLLTKEIFIRHFAKLYDFEIPESLVDFIAANSSSNKAELATIVKRLCEANKNEVVPSIELAQKIIDDTCKNQSCSTDNSLNGIYETLSELIGFDNTKKLYKNFKGKEISFPAELFSSESTINEDKDTFQLKKMSLGKSLDLFLNNN